MHAQCRRALTSSEKTGLGKSLPFLSAGIELNFAYVRLNVRHSECKEQIGKFRVSCHGVQILDY